MNCCFNFRLYFVLSVIILSGCATKATAPSSSTTSTPAINTPQLAGQNNYRTNKACIDVIKKFEGVRLNAYKGPGGHMLIGYGHKAGVVKGMKIDQARAEQLLKEDLIEVEQNVSRLVKVDVNENQFSAMVCLAYNIGWGAFGRSTLLKYLNQGNFKEASKQFKVWRMVNKKISTHQEKRRAKEIAIFNS